MRVFQHTRKSNRPILSRADKHALLTDHNFNLIIFIFPTESLLNELCPPWSWVLHSRPHIPVSLDPTPICHFLGKPASFCSSLNALIPGFFPSRAVPALLLPGLPLLFPDPDLSCISIENDTNRACRRALTTIFVSIEVRWADRPLRQHVVYAATT